MNVICVSILLSTLIFDLSSAGSQSVQAPALPSVLIAVQYNSCDGKDAANYTMHLEGSQACDHSDSAITGRQLIQGQSHGEKQVNSLTVLAGLTYPAGAYIQVESLYFVNGGPLAGKYVYTKTIRMMNAYWKKCTSVLGYSYVTSKSAVLLISDKLDMNVLISPTGGYEVFKKGCTTVCNGVKYIY